MLYTVPKAPNASSLTAGTMTTPVRHLRQKGNPTHVPLLSPFAPVAFRSCRLSLLSPFAPVAFRSCRLSLLSPFALSKALGKAFAMLCLLTLCLFLLLMPPAKAQGSWNGRPCDAQGNLINQPYNNGFYVLTGTQTGTLSNTYPAPMILAGLAYPSYA